MATSLSAAVQEIEHFETDDALHDFGGPHGSKGHDFASFWVIIRLIELEKLSQPDYLFVCEYMQDVAEFDSSASPTQVRLYQLKKKEDGYWQATDLTGQTQKQKTPKPDRPVMKLLKHVRAFKSTNAQGTFLSNGKFNVSLASGQSSVNDVAIGLHQLDAAHTDALKAAIATAEGISPTAVDLSVVELRSAALAVDDLQRHTSGVMLEYLGQVAPEHSGQAGSLVDTLYVRIKARARRTEKCTDWTDLVTRRGFAKSDFKLAVESLETVPDKASLRTKLLDKLSQDWRHGKTARVTIALTRCAREKVLAGEANRWATDSAAIAEICKAAEEQDLTDQECFETICTQLVDALPALTPEEISALAIYEMTEWTLNQIPA